MDSVCSLSMKQFLIWCVVDMNNEFVIEIGTELYEVNEYSVAEYMVDKMGGSVVSKWGSEFKRYVVDEHGIVRFVD